LRLTKEPPPEDLGAFKHLVCDRRCHPGDERGTHLRIDVQHLHSLLLPLRLRLALIRYGTDILRQALRCRCTIPALKRGLANFAVPLD
jgi:hypothetical protein